MKHSTSQGQLLTVDGSGRVPKLGRGHSDLKSPRSTLKLDGASDALFGEEKRTLLTLMVIQSKTNPQLAVPLFVRDVTRYFLVRPGVPGMLDKLDGTLNARHDNIKEQLFVGYEMNFDPQTPPCLVFSLLVLFLRHHCYGAIAQLEYKAYTTRLFGLFKKDAISDDDTKYEATKAFLGSQEAVMRRVLLELMQILGVILDNKHLNKCDVAEAALRLLDPMLQSLYESPDELTEEPGTLAVRWFLWCIAGAQRARLVRQQEAPLLGALATDFFHVKGSLQLTEPSCLSLLGERNLWCLGNLGTVEVYRRPQIGVVGSLKLSQPLFSATQVGNRYWIRGGMRAEIRVLEDPAVAAIKLDKNARCFLHVPEAKRVWGGSEGAITLFDDTTGAVVGSLPYSAQSTVQTAGGSKARVPVKFLARCGRHVLAAGGGGGVLLFTSDGQLVGALCESPAPHGEWAGFVEAGPQLVVGCTTTGALVGFVPPAVDVDSAATWNKKELKSSRDALRFLAYCEPWLFSTSGHDLLAFHAEHWQQVAIVRSVHASPITALAACPKIDKDQGKRCEVITGSADGVVLFWSAHDSGGAAGPTLGSSGPIDNSWRRIQRPSDAAVPLLVDVRSGASVHPEDVEIDRKVVVMQERYGTVYRGTWRGSDVAVHELSLESFSKAEVAELVGRLRETAVTHPRMCQLYCYSIIGTRLQLVTSFEPASLYDKLREKTLRFRARMRVAEQVAHFLAFLHHQTPPMVHLDVTTLSVRIDPHMNVRVDGLYGLARLRNLHLDQSSLSVSRSIRILPPELLCERPATPTPAADVYEFGMLLWALQEQSSPFSGIESLTELRAKVCDANQRPELSASCPRALRKAITDCWQADPEKRPTMNAVLESGVFTSALYEHTLGGDVAARVFWEERLCRTKGSSNGGQSVSCVDFMQELQRAVPQLDVKTAALLEQLFHTWLFKQGQLSLSDFGDFVGLFSPFALTVPYWEGVIADLTVPGMMGNLTSAEADARLAKGSKGDYVLRFASDMKKGLRLQTKGGSTLSLVRDQGEWRVESGKTRCATLEKLLVHLSKDGLKNAVPGGPLQEALRKVFPTDAERKASAKAVVIKSSNYMFHSGDGPMPDDYY